MGLFESGAQTAANMWTASKNKQDAAKNRQQQMDFTKSLPWEPAYASQTAPVYQQSQSPLARKYLETILTGDNPAMTFSGSPNAAAVKSAAVARGNFNYGTDQQNADQGATQRQRTPWAVTRTPSPGVSAQPGAAAPAGAPAGNFAPSSPFGAQTADNAMYPGLVGTGLDIEGLNKTSGLDLNDSDIAKLSGQDGFWGKYKGEPDDAHRKYDLISGLADPALAEAATGIKAPKKRWFHGRGKQILGG